MKLSELERTSRIDSEFYSKENLQVNKILQKLNIQPITKNFYVSDGNHMSVSEDFRTEGIPYYRGQDIYNIFIENASPIYISENYYNKENMRRSWLKKHDVLLSIVGAVIGNTSMVYADSKATCSCKLAILRAKNVSQNPFLLMCFLKSRYGQNQIQKFRRGTAQTGLLLEDMEQIFSPVFGGKFSEITKNIVNQIHKIIMRSQNIYHSAEKFLLSELDLDNFTPSTKNTAVKTFADVAKSGRLDAEYYQAKYDEVEKWIKFNDYITVFDVLSANNKNFLPLEQKRYKYIELANVENYGCINDDCIVANGAELPTRARRKVKTDDVIISSVEGSLDSCALITEKYDQALCSTGFYIMRSKEINAESLLLLFKSEPIRTLMKRGCSGTILSAISSDELKRIPLPVPGKIAQQQIAAKVRESFALREESKRLLKAATRAVEVAIEDGEDAATAYLADAGFGYDFVRGGLNCRLCNKKLFP